DFWEDKSPAGVDCEVDRQTSPAGIAVFERSCRKFADRPAFSNIGFTLNYAEQELHSAGFAASVQQLFEVLRGDRFGVVMPN
ncbi:long-chain fatty acid--CoA ligase, partial [Pseudomonas syringae pv. tagetis]